jgi:flagellar operon protein
MTPIEHNPALLRPGGLAPAGAPARPAPSRSGAAGEGPSFADVLRTQQREPVKFSGHALQRVQRRGIELDQATLGRLQEGVERAAGKGSRASVVLVDSTAFVVSVANRTVITAVDREHMKEQVFTNIDSAVIA